MTKEPIKTKLIKEIARLEKKEKKIGAKLWDNSTSLMLLKEYLNSIQ